MTAFPKKIRNLPLFLYDFLVLSISAFEDYFAKLKVMATKEEYVGNHLGICNPSEIRMMFKYCVAGGYTGYVNIKLFATPKCNDYEEAAEEILEHEILHQVLDRVIGFEAKKKLDNIHQSFYVLDIKTKKWQYVVKFINRNKNGRVAII